MWVDTVGVDLVARPSLLMFRGEIIQVAIERRDAALDHRLGVLRTVLAHVIGEPEVDKRDTVLAQVVVLVVRLIGQPEVDAEVAHAELEPGVIAVALEYIGAEERGF